MSARSLGACDRHLRSASSDAGLAAKAMVLYLDCSSRNSTCFPALAGLGRGDSFFAVSPLTLGSCGVHLSGRSRLTVFQAGALRLTSFGALLLARFVFCRAVVLLVWAEPSSILAPAALTLSLCGSARPTQSRRLSRQAWQIQWRGAGQPACRQQTWCGPTGQASVTQGTHPKRAQ